MRIYLAAAILLSSLFSALSHANTLYDLSFENTQQTSTSMAEYRDKVILVNFWATWCPPCVKEMPSMERLRQHFKGQPFEIVAINAGEQSSAVDAFLQEMATRGTPLTFPVLLDQKGRSFREFGLKGLPMSFIFDRHGNQLETIGGGVEWDSEENIAKFERLLQQ